MKEIEISESEIMGVSYFIIDNLKNKDIFIENVFDYKEYDEKDSIVITNYLKDNYELTKDYIIEFIKFRKQQIGKERISYKNLSKQFSFSDNIYHPFISVIKNRLMRIVYELVDDFYCLDKNGREKVISSGEEFYTYKDEISKRKIQILEKEQEIKELELNVVNMETSDIFEYIIKEMGNKRLFFEEFDNEVDGYSDFMIEFMNTHRSVVNEFILYMVSFRKYKKYDDLDRDTFKYKFYYDLVEIFNDLAFGCDWSDDEDYVAEVKGYSMTKADVLLETIYHLIVEYELSPFERESVKCFGKNLFSGKEFDKPEYRE